MTKRTVSKEQVRKLSPEEQETFAAMEARRLRSRQQLRDRAGRGMTITAGLLAGLVGGLAIMCVILPRLIPLAIIAVSGLVGYHMNRLYRRLDAMMELLDEDIQKTTEMEQSDDDPAAFR